MASETLSIPEEHLKEVILVIRVGLAHVSVLSGKITLTTRDNLMNWCDKEEEYLNMKEGWND